MKKTDPTTTYVPRGEKAKKIAIRLLTVPMALAIGLATIDRLIAISSSGKAAKPVMEKTGLSAQDTPKTISTEVPEGFVQGRGEVATAPDLEADLTADSREAIKQASSLEEPYCSIDYAAVFALNGQSQCVRNPTAQMPHWGPPSSGWFRGKGGEFRIAASDLLADTQCQCLAAQDAYVGDSTLQNNRAVDLVTLNGTTVAIEKWVCGDPCLGAEG